MARNLPTGLRGARWVAGFAHRFRLHTTRQVPASAAVEVTREGLSFPEIAERLGRSVGAATMLWARAVHQFRLATPEQP